MGLKVILRCIAFGDLLRRYYSLSVVEVLPLLINREPPVCAGQVGKARGLGVTGGSLERKILAYGAGVAVGVGADKVATCACRIAIAAF